MKVTAWRIAKAKHVVSAFTGEGARLYGGRWNSSNSGMVYTAGSISLATLEMFVHLRNEIVMGRYVIFEVTFDSSLVSAVNIDELPDTWRDCPSPHEVQIIGDEWIRSGCSAVLKVPSAVIPSEFNFLLNPNHKHFGKIDIGPEEALLFDKRLL